MRLDIRYLVILCALVSESCVSAHVPERKAMSRQECSASTYCVAEGSLTIERVDHVKMGKLSLPDGSCINLSLSKAAIKRAERSPGQLQKIEGDVRHGDFDEDMTSLRVNGRLIGLSQCQGFYVFVK